MQQKRPSFSNVIKHKQPKKKFQLKIDEELSDLRIRTQIWPDIQSQLLVIDSFQYSMWHFGPNHKHPGI